MTLQHPSTSVLRRPAERQAPSARAERRGAARPQVPGQDDRGLRVLFVGAGLDSAWSAGRRSASTADIARGLRAITGRPCAIERIGDAAADAEAVSEDLAARSSSSCDGAVVTIGCADAMRLTPVTDWGARIVDLVDAVQAALPEGAPVLVVGAPTVHVPKRVQPLNPIALRHAARLDRVTQRLAEIRTGVHYVPAPGLAKLVGRRAGGDLSAAFSLPIASALAGALRDRPAPRSTARSLRADRLDLRVLVDAARTDALAVLRGLVRRAEDEFQVAEAAISLFDGEHRWRITSSGSGPVDQDRSLMCCETVVCTAEPLVVTDRGPSRFPAQAHAGLPLPPFYAGVPVHAEDGTAVGAMCLLEAVPRATSVDIDRLRDYAHEAERVIRSVAAAAGWLAPLPAD